MTITSPQLKALLDEWPVAHLATADATGVPHLVPIVFCRLGDTLYTPIDGKPKSSGTLKRMRNVRENPRVAVLLDHYDDDWNRLWWVRLDARAEASPLSATHAAEVRDALERKYPQYVSVPVFNGPTAMCLTIVWHRATGWAPGGFAGVPGV